MRHEAATAKVTVARGQVYAGLSRGFSYPESNLFAALESGEFVDFLAGSLAVLPGAASLAGHLQRLREATAADLRSAPERADWEAEYVRLYGQGQNLAAVPYETEFTCTHLWQQQQEMADIAGFYRAFGVEVATGRDRPDWIATELEFMYLLCTKEALALEEGDGSSAAVCRDAQARFLEDHLGTWTGVLATLTTRHAQRAFYPALAALADAWVAQEAAGVRVQPRKIVRLTPLRGDGLGPERPGAGGKPGERG